MPHSKKTLTKKEEIRKDLNRFYSGINPKPHSLKEVPLCEELSRAIGGKTEVKTPVGRIDLLRDDLILEAKKSKYAKHAIGQLFCYSIYYERDFKAIGLIDYPPNWIPEVCEKWDIILLYYNLNEFRWRIV